MTPEERDRLTSLEVQYKLLSKQVTEIHKDTKAIREQANRWRGALGVILGLGGLIGVILSFFKTFFTGT